jgi:hypothetical protein
VDSHSYRAAATYPSRVPRSAGAPQPETASQEEASCSPIRQDSCHPSKNQRKTKKGSVSFPFFNFYFFFTCFLRFLLRLRFLKF